MKRLATLIALYAGLAAAPAMADHSGGSLLNRENVGGAIGAAVGGFLGNEISDRKPAVTAAGAVGGWLLGRNLAHNYNRSPARRTYGDNHDWDSRRYHRDPDWEGRSRRLDPVNRTFVARTTTNVRSGPSTRFHITGQLRHHERVHVVGKVRGRNWVMIRDHGQRGFVYAPLLRPYRHYGQDRGYGHDRHYGQGGFHDRDRGNRAGW